MSCPIRYSAGLRVPSAECCWVLESPNQHGFGVHQNAAPYTPGVCDMHTRPSVFRLSSTTRPPLRPDELLGLRLGELPRCLLE